MDEAAWGALALALTVLGGIWTWATYRRRGVTPALRAGAVTLLPVAAWLTGVLELLTEIGGAVGDWAVDLAFSPTMWLGVGLGGLAVVLLVVSGVLDRRGIGSRQPATRRSRRQVPPGTSPAPGPVAPDAPVSGVDAEMAEIEAILRKRGIT